MKAGWSVLAVIFLAFSVAVSCDDDDAPTVCGVLDPVNDLPWLKAQVDRMDSDISKKYSYLEQAEYEGQTIFYFNSCCPMCLIIIIYYDCDGNKLDSVDPGKVKNSRRIWAAEENECSFYD